jgi:excinuclease ABC subunit B
MAQCIAKVSRPTLVLCHNKTLAAQLARELKSYFPRNCVELFVSYYNFYLPESYSPASDTYIAKSSSINEELDALRHRATRSLSERRDVIVVASVSCIYGIGLPKNYLDARLVLSVGEARAIEEVLAQLQGMLYSECETSAELERGCVAVQHTVASSDILVWPPYEEAPLRLRFAMGQLVTIRMVGALDGSPEAALPAAVVYPARHHVTPREQLERACDLIEAELAERLAELEQEEHAAGEGITTTSDRLRHRTMVDLEAMRETGYCQGMENYSRHLAGRAAGAAPDTLVDYLEAVSGGESACPARTMGAHACVSSRDARAPAPLTPAPFPAAGAGGWLLVVDESHVTLPQLRGMYAADRSRKQALVRHGFRLPSALDNRPLRDGEFWDKVGDALFLSATPGELELQMVGAEGGVGASGVEEGVVDMVLRPTHVLDPEIHVRETEGQLDHLLEEVKARAARKQASLAMTITKRDAEDLAGWFVKHSVRAQYLHSGLKTIERSEVLEKLQKGELDVLVGVNLLREGLDLPQVSLVAILDADKEGFLRSDRSLIQTIGRAARHRHGTAIFYADRVTGSMRRCIDETNRRRRIQHEHNTKHGLVPQSTKGREMASLFSIERAALKSSLAESAAWSHDRSHAAPTPAAGRAPPPPPRTEELTCEEDSEWDDTPAAEGQRGALTGVPSGVSDAEWDSHVARLRAEAARLPRSSAGVYMWRAAPQDGQGAGSGSDGAAEGEILYVGKAKRLRARALSYLVGGGRRHGPRIRAMLWRAESIECIITPGGEHDALLLEARMIKQHLPRYNVLLRDDRFYPYVCVTLHQPLPAVFSVPSKTSKEADARARFFGPYTDPSAMRSQLFLIEDVAPQSPACVQ